MNTLEAPDEAIARLDALGRTRALTNSESLYLVRLIRAEKSAQRIRRVAA